MSRWMLTQFFRDSTGLHLIPICSAYGNHWRCPMYPATDDGWALVEIVSAPNQLEAAKADPRVLVCPLLFDPSAVPQPVVDAYAAHGAAAGMSMGLLLSTLNEVEPIYSHTL